MVIFHSYVSLPEGMIRVIILINGYMVMIYPLVDTIFTDIIVDGTFLDGSELRVSWFV